MSGSTAYVANLGSNTLQVFSASLPARMVAVNSNGTFASVPLPNAANFIQNTTARQASSNFNLSGAGVLGGSLSVGNSASAAARGTLDVRTGNTYLVADPNTGSSQDVFLPGHLYLAPYVGSSGTAFVQARVPNPTTTTQIGLTLRTTRNGALVNALTLNPDGSASFVGTVTATNITSSDARLKTQVRPLTGALAAVQGLRGVRYRYLENIPGKPLPTGEQVGVIAQEVEALYPELVHTGADGYKAVNYAQLTPVLLEALKEQQRQIEALQTRATTAEARAAQATAATEALDARLRRLESAAGGQARQ